MGIFNGGVEKEFYPEIKLAFGGFRSGTTFTAANNEKVR
jgi:hypothetical protein